MKRTKTLLAFLSVLIMTTATKAQASYVWAQDTLTVAQIQEDFNYMIEQYERIHPNPTWSLGEEQYNELKQQTLAQLDRPMPLLDFVVLFDYASTEHGTAEQVEDRYIMTFRPKEPQYNGRLYFIQSQFTYSAAVILTNLAKQYGFGTLIGEETGGLTTTYIRLNQRKLPNSGLTFYCSDKQNRYLGTTGPRGVLPDTPLEIGYKYLFRSFTAEELQQMIEMSNSKR